MREGRNRRACIVDGGVVKCHRKDLPGEWPPCIDERCHLDNIRYGIGLDHGCDLERIADAVRETDIIGLQEVERFWRRSAMADQPERLGALLPFHHWVYCLSFDVDASTLRDDGRVLNRRRQFGPMLLSKWPILSARRIALPQLRCASIRSICGAFRRASG